jgi:hypothetical protein
MLNSFILATLTLLVQSSAISHGLTGNVVAPISGSIVTPDCNHIGYDGSHWLVARNYTYFSFVSPIPTQPIGGYCQIDEGSQQNVDLINMLLKYRQELERNIQILQQLLIDLEKQMDRLRKIIDDNGPTRKAPDHEKSSLGKKKYYL